MPFLSQDLRYGTRTLLRSPGFSAVVVAVLALGIGANSAIFSVVNAVLLRPLPYRDPGRLYRLEETSPKGEPSGASPADMLVFHQRTRVFEQLAVSHWQNVTLTGPQGPENVYGGRVSSDAFLMLGSAPALGRVFSPEEFAPGAPGVVLLSGRLWNQRYHRDPSVLGRTLTMGGNPFTVIGVMPDEFFFDQRFELWTPWQFTADDRSKRDARTHAFVRLRPGVTPQQAQAEVLAVFRDIGAEDVRKGWSVRLIPVAEQLTSRVRSALLISLGAVGMVLLIACLNVANLLLVRAAARHREIAIRAALGAGRLRMVRQLLTESLLLAFAGGAAGLLLGWWGARSLVALFPERIPLPRLEQTRLDALVLLFTLGLALLTGILFGLIPALRAARPDLYEGLKEGGRSATSGPRSRRLRNLLVIAETALSLVLLTGAGLMLRSFDRLMRVDPGFSPDGVLTLRVPLSAAITERAQQRAYFARILERIESLPGLNASGLIVPLPLADVDANGTFALEGHPPPPGERQLVKLRVASPGYFRAMGIPVRRGRVFGQTDGAGAPPVAVVSESLARRYFPGEDAVGRRVTMNEHGKGPFMTIVGVVADVKYLELGGNPEPEMYRDYRQFLFAPFAMSVALRARAGDPMQLAATVQKEIRAIAPDQPVTELKTMRRVVAANVSQPRFYTLLLGIYAAIALLLAATGLYGVLAHTVSQRAQEIGIRMALGAPRRSILRLVLTHALLLVSAGVVLGLGGALALTRLISAQLYNTTPTDPVTFAAVSVLMIAVAAAAAYVPARRAVRVDPMVALRCE
jgi:predicted permease